MWLTTPSTRVPPVCTTLSGAKGPYPFVVSVDSAGFVSGHGSNLSLPWCFVTSLRNVHAGNSIDSAPQDILGGYLTVPSGMIVVSSYSAGLVSRSV